MTSGADGAPAIPQTQIADIGAGSYPAVMNIMFALWAARREGRGACLDISMCDNLSLSCGRRWPWVMPPGAGRGGTTCISPARRPVTGSTARATANMSPAARWSRNSGRISARSSAWTRSCATTNATLRRRPTESPRASRARDAAHWRAAFAASRDVCAGVVRRLDEALADPQFAGRGLFSHMLETGRRRCRHCRSRWRRRCAARRGRRARRRSAAPIRCSPNRRARRRSETRAPRAADPGRQHGVARQAPARALRRRDRRRARTRVSRTARRGSGSTSRFSTLTSRARRSPASTAASRTGSTAWP